MQKEDGGEKKNKKRIGGEEKSKESMSEKRRDEGLWQEHCMREAGVINTATHCNTLQHPATPCNTRTMHEGIWEKMRHHPILSVMSHMNESCLIWMSHVSYEWVMSHMNESCLIRTSRARAWERTARVISCEFMIFLRLVNVFVCGRLIYGWDIIYIYVHIYHMSGSCLI